MVGRDLDERAGARMASPASTRGPKTRGGPSRLVSSGGAAADAARREIRGWITAKGHVVDNARAAVVRLEAAFHAVDLQRTPELMPFLADLPPALDQAEGQKLS